MEYCSNILCDTYIESEMVPQLIKSDKVARVKLFALGPEGTNISQAAKLWAEHLRILDKTEMILCATPEDEVEEAMKVDKKGVVPIFALCAVYNDLCKLFFKYGSNYTFLHHFYMRLDKMQLASKKYINETMPNNATIASHYSPSVLLENTEYNICMADSNAAAARKCFYGETDACITTETARKIYGLNTLKEFGAPSMLFTFGTTEHGIRQLQL